MKKIFISVLLGVIAGFAILMIINKNYVINFFDCNEKHEVSPIVKEVLETADSIKMDSTKVVNDSIKVDSIKNQKDTIKNN